MRRIFAVLAVTLALGACATTGGRANDAPAQIIKAETDFARRAGEIGITPAFREVAAPGVIMFLPGPMVANDYLAGANWPGTLLWRPEAVVVSAAGDLAVSMGPSEWTINGEVDPGYFLTIWGRQPDGSWKFLLDRGTPGTPNFYKAPARTPETHLLARAPASETATPESLEAGLRSAVMREGPVAISGRMASFGRVIRPGVGPVTENGGWVALLIKDPQPESWTVLGGGKAVSGDLIWTYGETRWTANGKARTGHWVRAWVRTGGEWRIFMDHQAALPEA
ncbi:hypothetical protein GVN21_19330 [Caulobacter sp. SLTY]|uniref:hypothetical protein n=1 Tax=Caulobacter sp. SLTY TaxID=2683262 RepID=UPI001412C599|nr:hypothetical protein [Caulobacter sp. SLTY]NBB17519.1 hypothetical protein [Caulobacter sp. SLTY]